MIEVEEAVAVEVVSKWCRMIIPAIRAEMPGAGSVSREGMTVAVPMAIMQKEDGLGEATAIWMSGGVKMGRMTTGGEHHERDVEAAETILRTDRHEDANH